MLEFCFDADKSTVFKKAFGVCSTQTSSSKDPFIFINKRPCDFKKLNKAINEVYRKFFDPKSLPFYVLFMEIAQGKKHLFSILILQM